MIGRTSEASRFNIDKFSEVLGLRGIDKVVGKRDDFVVEFWESVTARAREFCSSDEIFVFCGKFR